jgi:preprotein translocase subunit SecG
MVESSQLEQTFLSNIHSILITKAYAWLSTLWFNSTLALKTQWDDRVNVQPIFALV